MTLDEAVVTLRQFGGSGELGTFAPKTLYLRNTRWYVPRAAPPGSSRIAADDYLAKRLRSLTGVSHVSVTERGITFALTACATHASLRRFVEADGSAVPGTPIPGATVSGELMPSETVPGASELSRLGAGELGGNMPDDEMVAGAPHERQRTRSGTEAEAGGSAPGGGEQSAGSMGPGVVQDAGGRSRKGPGAAGAGAQADGVGRLVAAAQSRVNAEVAFTVRVGHVVLPGVRAACLDDALCGLALYASRRGLPPGVLHDSPGQPEGRCSSCDSPPGRRGVADQSQVCRTAPEQSEVRRDTRDQSQTCRDTGEVGRSRRAGATASAGSRRCGPMVVANSERVAPCRNVEELIGNVGADAVRFAALRVPSAKPVVVDQQGLICDVTTGPLRNVQLAYARLARLAAALPVLSTQAPCPGSEPCQESESSRECASSPASTACPPVEPSRSPEPLPGVAPHLEREACSAAEGACPEMVGGTARLAALVLELPYVIERAVSGDSPHIVVRHVEKMADEVHPWYAEQFAVRGRGASVSHESGDVALVATTACVALRRALGALGLSAPLRV